MRGVTYHRGDHALLERLAAKPGSPRSLCCPEFVDHYYAGSPWCRLHLLLDHQGDVLGTLGLERMPFAVAGRRLTLGFGSNFVALRRGAGGLLLLKWLKTCDFGLMLGGSEDAHRLVRGHGWTRYANVRRFCLNRGYPSQRGEAWWKRLARIVLRHLEPETDVAERAERILRDGPPAVAAVEQRRFAEDLLPETSPFCVRFAPDVEYLDWRYRTGLPFVRYRLFRVLCDGRSAGYVVINEQPDRLFVAHCDGHDPWVLSRGVFAALAAVSREKGGRREVFLVASHRVMQAALRQFGFREIRRDCPLFVGGLGGVPPLPPDTGQWLVNFDWGDNGLRPPFLGRPAIGGAADRRTAIPGRRVFTWHRASAERPAARSRPC